MARMIPDIPKQFDIRSKEGVLFNELSNLPDDYYVFHSFSILDIKDSTLSECEIDFVIFNPKKGILCIEAKSGHVEYEDGIWKYGSGVKMSHDGPYAQASGNKWRLKEYMKNHGLENELGRCKLLHAVWFPDVSLNKFANVNLPAEASLNITLTSEAFGNIKDSIDKVFDLETKNGVITLLSEKDTQKILERVLAPSFNLISIKQAELERTKNVFKRMLKEQVALLNYLEEQNNAIINGLAGTGKTVIAVEKARRHAEKGEEVLFLCYNSFLKDFLRENYNYQHVSFYTLDGWACKICESSIPDYRLLADKLADMFLNNTFPYEHVIIDEGQDFGKFEEEIIESLRDNVINENKSQGSFYIFYDKNQMIQSDSIPKYIENADCKLTLYKNCRNTQNIATTSLRFLGSTQMPKLYDGAIGGDLPKMCFCVEKESFVKTLNSIIDEYVDSGFNDITILTCKTEDTSIISEYCKNSKYKYQRGYVRFTTCRKFKGLESDIVIVIDIDKDTFNTVGEQLMYVGTSRARYMLTSIISLNEDECKQILLDREVKPSKIILKNFATAFNSKLLNIKY